MKTFTAVMNVLAAVVCAGMLFSVFTAGADTAESVSGADALRMINSSEHGTFTQVREGSGSVLSPELSAETEAAETLEVRRVSGGLVEVFKSNGVVLVYDGAPEDGALIGARFSDAE